MPTSRYPTTISSSDIQDAAELDALTTRTLETMRTINKVAISGATGRLGPVVVSQLLEDGFKVTILTRKGSSHSYPSSVTVTRIDYESPESLVKALEGQDAVVSTVGPTGLLTQLPLIEAAIKAGVKRFIPSEYVGPADNEKTYQLPQFVPKKAVSDALKKEAAAGTLTYSFISTGLFLEMGIQLGILIDLKGKNVTLWNGGDQPFSASTIPSVAQAISGVLQRPEETKNRNVFVHSVHISLKELLEKSKKVVGSEGWNVEFASTEDRLKKGYADLAKGNFDVLSFGVSAIWGEGYGGHFESVDNDLLGVKLLDDAGLRSLLEEYAK